MHWTSIKFVSASHVYRAPLVSAALHVFHLFCVYNKLIHGSIYYIGVSFIENILSSCIIIFEETCLVYYPKINPYSVLNSILIND